MTPATLTVATCRLMGRIGFGCARIVVGATCRATATTLWILAHGASGKKIRKRCAKGLRSV